MDRQKLKLIVKNLELLVDSLKSEVYSDTEAFTDPSWNYNKTPRNLDLNTMKETTMDTQTNQPQNLKQYIKW